MGQFLNRCSAIQLFLSFLLYVFTLPSSCKTKTALPGFIPKDGGPTILILSPLEMLVQFKTTCVTHIISCKDITAREISTQPGQSNSTRACPLRIQPRVNLRGFPYHKSSIFNYKLTSLPVIKKLSTKRGIMLFWRYHYLIQRGFLNRDS